MNIIENINHKLPGELALELAKRLREHRRRAGYTQPIFAKRAGVSCASLKRFEQTGEISFVSLLKIVSALDRIDEVSDLFVEVKYKNLKEAMNAFEKNQRA